uniref:Transmembrane protein 231 n=1 Tax=Leptocylindrus danicus TaxID=163516 RepID=A0A7S2NU27_9STRA|mmetsp:Transcript_12082/g.18227  ORF Transcript_12082/g.18227 Transcript_12082/m.18227 type:complete len:365 (+) Transcript_12082:117-1211(+)
MKIITKPSRSFISCSLLLLLLLSWSGALVVAKKADDDISSSSGEYAHDDRIINVVPGNQSVSSSIRTPVVYQVSIRAVNPDDEHDDVSVSNSNDTDVIGNDSTGGDANAPTNIIIEVSPPVFCTHSDRYQMWWVDDDDDIENDLRTAGNRGVADIAFNGNDTLLVNDLKGQMQNRTVMSLVIGNTSFATPQLQALGSIPVSDDVKLDYQHSLISMIAKVVVTRGSFVVGETQQSVDLITGFHDISPLSVKDNTWFDSFEVALYTYITYPGPEGNSIIRIRESTTSDDRPIGYVHFDRLADQKPKHVVPFWNWHWHDYYRRRNHVEEWSRAEAIFLAVGLTIAFAILFGLICNDSRRYAGYRRIQ